MDQNTKDIIAAAVMAGVITRPQAAQAIKTGNIKRWIGEETMQQLREAFGE